MRRKDLSCVGSRAGRLLRYDAAQGRVRSWYETGITVRPRPETAGMFGLEMGRVGLGFKPPLNWSYRARAPEV